MRNQNKKEKIGINNGRLCRFWNESDANAWREFKERAKRALLGREFVTYRELKSVLKQLEASCVNVSVSYDVTSTCTYIKFHYMYYDHFRVDCMDFKYDVEKGTCSMFD